MSPGQIGVTTITCAPAMLVLHSFRCNFTMTSGISEIFVIKKRAGLGRVENHWLQLCFVGNR